MFVWMCVSDRPLRCRKASYHWIQTTTNYQCLIIIILFLPSRELTHGWVYIICWRWYLPDSPYQYITMLRNGCKDLHRYEAFCNRHANGFLSAYVWAAFVWAQKKGYWVLVCSSGGPAATLSVFQVPQKKMEWSFSPRGEGMRQCPAFMCCVFRPSSLYFTLSSPASIPPLYSNLSPLNDIT